MRRSVSWIIPGIIVLFLLSPCCSPTEASDLASPLLTQAEKEQIALDFAPVLHFDPTERTFPVGVEYFLSCSDLKLSGNPAPVTLGLDYAFLGSPPCNVPGSGYFLDNRFGGVDDDGVIERYEADRADLTDTVYAHVTTDDDSLLVQYWMFYVFNYGPLNRHEGDWEMFELVLDSTRSPISAVYSQHEGGLRVGWEDVAVEDGHPAVYVGRGSHANFPLPGEKPMGPGGDIVRAGGPFMIAGLDCRLSLLGEPGDGNRPSDQAWLDFAGNWGEYRSGSWNYMMGRNGPLGPAFRADGEMYSSASFGASFGMTSVADGAGNEGVTVLIIVAAFSFAVIATAVVMIRRK